MTEDQAQFTGTVKRTFAHSRGTALELTVQSPKQKYPTYLTVWADLDVQMGDRVTVAGYYSDKIDSYQAPSGVKTTIRRSLNDVRLIERHDADAPPATNAPAEETPPEDPWGSEPPAQWDVAPIPGQEDTPW